MTLILLLSCAKEVVNEPGTPSKESAIIPEATRPSTAASGAAPLILEAVADVPPEVSRLYRLSLNEDRTALTIDPAAARRGMPRESGRGVTVIDSGQGGKILRLAEGPFLEGTWIEGPLTSITTTTQRKTLEDAGVDTTRSRHLLEVSAKRDDQPTYLAFRSDVDRPGIVRISADVTILDFSRPAPPRPLRKPVVYLYPTRTIDVRVDVQLDGDFLAVHPAMEEDGWHVRAQPDGTLHGNGRDHRYLFWEGIGPRFEIDREAAFLVAGQDAASFLDGICDTFALTDFECGDFTTYWLPELAANPYNIVGFPTDAYTRAVPLVIEPRPDTVNRLFMIFKPSHRAVRVTEPLLSQRKRRGFTVVEWGGAAL